jgi:uridylate kinase
VLIYGGGAGMTFFSTATVAAQRALAPRCEVILMGKQGVDGVYDSDPKTNPDAVKFDQLSYDEYLARDLKVADATGIAMARDNRMDMVFFNLSTPGTIGRAVRGEKIGTLVSSTA